MSKNVVGSIRKLRALVLKGENGKKIPRVNVKVTVFGICLALRKKASTV